MTRAVLIGMIAATLLPHLSRVVQQPAPAGAVYVAYYWRAKPGQLDAYNEYIRTVAVPIDEDARKAGVFDEVRHRDAGTGDRRRLDASADLPVERRIERCGGRAGAQRRPRRGHRAHR